MLRGKGERTLPDVPVFREAPNDVTYPRSRATWRHVLFREAGLSRRDTCHLSAKPDTCHMCQSDVNMIPLWHMVSIDVLLILMLTVLLGMLVVIIVTAVGWNKLFRRWNTDMV